MHLLIQRSDDNARRLGTAIYTLSQRVDNLSTAVAVQRPAPRAPPPLEARTAAAAAAAAARAAKAAAAHSQPTPKPSGGTSGGSSKLSRGNLVIVLADSSAVQRSFDSSATVSWQGAKDLALLGKLGCVRKIDRSDGTIEVRFVDDTRRWFPPAALQGPLSLGDGMNVRELGPEPLGKGEARSRAKAQQQQQQQQRARSTSSSSGGGSGVPSASPGTMPSAGPGVSTRTRGPKKPAGAASSDDPLASSSTQRRQQQQPRQKQQQQKTQKQQQQQQRGGGGQQSKAKRGSKNKNQIRRRRGAAAVDSDSDEDSAQALRTREKAAETDSWLLQQQLSMGAGGAEQSKYERERQKRDEAERVQRKSEDEKARREEIMSARKGQKAARKAEFDRKEEEMRARLKADQAKLRGRTAQQGAAARGGLEAERTQKRAGATKKREILKGLFGEDEDGEGEEGKKEGGSGDTKKKKKEKKKTSLFDGLPDASFGEEIATGASLKKRSGGLFDDTPLEIDLFNSINEVRSLSTPFLLYKCLLFFYRQHRCSSHVSLSPSLYRSLPGGTRRKAQGRIERTFNGGSSRCVKTQSWSGRSGHRLCE